MDFGKSLEKLNFTSDECDRFSEAFKDEKFKKMFQDYVEEISDPENRKIYEEEITLLEEERGNSIEFIHPTPFRVIKTSINGKKKCFINICANEKVGKAELKHTDSRGHCWCLPHLLPPGRQSKDLKGETFMTYDVIFHPDTLHMTKNKKFMDMVVNTAIEGIQKAFSVILDQTNARIIKSKYKGTPQESVIRKPIPGAQAKKPPEKPDPIAFPYPDTAASTKEATMSRDQVEQTVVHVHTQTTKEPTKPNYTVKYRSVIDLQDYRCSRDSAQSPRPKAIMVTVELPLLGSVRDASLEVREKSLLLECKHPAYRLELPLAYPVEEEKGEAKFNKQTRQLTVSLPVAPAKQDLDHFLGHSPSVSDSQLVGLSSEEESTNTEEELDEGEKVVQLPECELDGKEDDQNERQKGTEDVDGGDLSAERRDSGQEDGSFMKTDFSAEEATTSLSDKRDFPPKTVNVEAFFPDKHCSVIAEDKEAKLFCSFGSAPKTASPCDQDEQKKQNTQAEKCTELQTHSTEETLTTTSGSNMTENTEVRMTQQSLRPAKQLDRRPEPALLREIDEHGKETVISDHSTSAGFTFQNVLMFELD